MLVWGGHSCPPHLTLILTLANPQPSSGARSGRARFQSRRKEVRWKYNEVCRATKAFMEYAEPILVESPDAKAIRLLNEQLKELGSVRGLSSDHPQFKAWHNTTVSLLKRFLAPTSPHLESFIDIGFWTHIYPAPPGHEHKLFVDGCRTAEASLKAVVKEIENFGVHAEQHSPKTAAGQGGVHQTFHGPVTIQSQAIATDNAIQKIGNIGSTIGASLKEIADIFRESEELTQRQVKEGLAGIEALAVEVRKPEAKRNWRSVLDCGQVVLAIADKATDLAHKFCAPRSDDWRPRTKREARARARVTSDVKTTGRALPRGSLGSLRSFLALPAAVPVRHSPSSCLALSRHTLARQRIPIVAFQPRNVPGLVYLLELMTFRAPRGSQARFGLGHPAAATFAWLSTHGPLC